MLTLTGTRRAPAADAKPDATYILKPSGPGQRLAPTIAVAGQLFRLEAVDCRMLVGGEP